MFRLLHPSNHPSDEGVVYRSRAKCRSRSSLKDNPRSTTAIAAIRAASTRGGRAPERAADEALGAPRRPPGADEAFDLGELGGAVGDQGWPERSCPGAIYWMGV